MHVQNNVEGGYCQCTLWRGKVVRVRTNLPERSSYSPSGERTNTDCVLNVGITLYSVLDSRRGAARGAAETAPPPPPPSHLSLELGKVVRDLCAVLFLSDLSSHSCYMFSCAQLEITGMVGIYYCVVLLTSPKIYIMLSPVQ